MDQRDELDDKLRKFAYPPTMKNHNMDSRNTLQECDEFKEDDDVEPLKHSASKPVIRKKRYIDLGNDDEPPTKRHKIVSDIHIDFGAFSDDESETTNNSNKATTNTSINVITTNCNNTTTINSNNSNNANPNIPPPIKLPSKPNTKELGDIDKA